MTDEPTTVTQGMVLEVNFEFDVPKFDMEEFKVAPFTCSSADVGWSMHLPSVSDFEGQNIEIEMVTESEWFLFNQKT